ncbi:MAG: restriction endonuclease subunit S [Verrucomicrobiia bacterium]
MASDGALLTLANVVTLQRGTTYKSALLGQPGPVLLGLASIQRNGGFRDDNLKTYGGDSPEKLTLHPGDIYVSLKDVTQSADLLGSIARVPTHVPSGRVTQDTVKLSFIRKDVPSCYIYWLLRTPFYREYCRAHAIGTTNLSLAREDFLAFPVPRPKTRELTLVETLDALDDKIELNRRSNETLEALAQSIFKSLFVDASATKLPKGWDVRALYDCADYINGAAFRNEHFSAERQGLPVVKIGELKNGISAQTKFCEVEREPKYRIASGEILFSWSGSPDTSIDIFVWADGDGWLNQHIFKIQFKRPVEKFFVYYLLRHLKPVFIEIARDKQTTGLGHVTGQDLKRLKTAFPPDDVLQGFNQVTEPLFQKVYSNLCESRTLAELRDALLPKLLSGELRMPNK